MTNKETIESLKKRFVNELREVEHEFSDNSSTKYFTNLEKTLFDKLEYLKGLGLIIKGYNHDYSGQSDVYDVDINLDDEKYTLRIVRDDAFGVEEII